MPQPVLYFVRHGETDWNRERRLQGQHDIPLNPLGRARETMEIMRDAMGLDPAAYRTDARLMEMSFGRWEGFTYADLQTREAAALAARAAVSRSARAASITAMTAATVSPAPDTSRTLTG